MVWTVSCGYTLLLGNHLAHVVHRTPECADLGSVLAPLQQASGSYHQLVGGFKGIADDVIICGQAPLALSVDGRTFLVEHLLVICHNIEIACDTYVVLGRNKTLAENPVSQPGARQFKAFVAW